MQHDFHKFKFMTRLVSVVKGSNHTYTKDPVWKTRQTKDENYIIYTVEYYH